MIFFAFYSLPVRPAKIISSIKVHNLLALNHKMTDLVDIWYGIQWKLYNMEMVTGTFNLNMKIRNHNSKAEKNYFKTDSSFTIVAKIFFICKHLYFVNDECSAGWPKIGHTIRLPITWIIYICLESAWGGNKADGCVWPCQLYTMVKVREACFTEVF